MPLLFFIKKFTHTTQPQPKQERVTLFHAKADDTATTSAVALASAEVAHRLAAAPAASVWWRDDNERSVEDFHELVPVMEPSLFFFVLWCSLFVS